MRGSIYVYHHNNMIWEYRFKIIQMPSRWQAEATLLIPIRSKCEFYFFLEVRKCG